MATAKTAPDIMNPRLWLLLALAFAGCVPSWNPFARGHCLINETDKPFRYIMIGDNDPHEVCVYPDSHKIQVRSLDRAIIRDGERLDYWDGEQTD